MHGSSMRHVADLVSRYLERGKALKVVDVGSYDVNGSYKEHFDDPAWKYVGVDLEAGPNVDIVLQSPYRLPFLTGSIDVLVSGQAIEHMDYFWLSWLEMVRVVAPGGLLFLLAPSRGPEHRYPVDCWRFYPDGFRALARWGGVEMVEVTTDWASDEDRDSALWGDTVGVFRAHAPTLGERCGRALLRLAARQILRDSVVTGTNSTHGGQDTRKA